jgi:hypothetical protein
LPDDPQGDSYIFAIKEANAFRTLCQDPSVFLEDGEEWSEPQSDTIRGDTTTMTTKTKDIQVSCANRDHHSKANQQDTVTANWASMKHRYTEDDLQRLRPWLAWIPIENIRKTLENTTQIAKAVTNYPMIRHLTSRFKLLNRFRLREVVSTDTIFSSVQAIGGIRCAQVFYGLTSHHMDVYGMENKSQFPEVYKEFIRDQGVPSGLHRDNAPEQKSHVVTQINRDYEVMESFAEAGNPNQNPVESQAIRWLKRAGERLLNHTGAPDFGWIWAYQYLPLVNNGTADRTLRWKCPHTKRFGVTPDISALLSFHFYEPVYYLDIEEQTPCTKEKAGYWLGVAHNVGDALTYHILADGSQQVIQRSVVRSRRDVHGINKRVIFDPNLDPTVTLNTENQKVYPREMVMSDEPIPTERWHKRHRKMRRDRGGRTRLPAPVHITTYHNEDNLWRDGNGGIDVTDDLLGDVPDTALEEEDFDLDEMEDMRKAFLARYEKSPKYKFGVQIPTSISHALRLDKLNGNNLWQEAIQKEMGHLAEYQTFWTATEEDNLGTYQLIPYHMVFDCKFDGRRKGRLVAGGNHTIVTSEQVYSGVVEGGWYGHKTAAATFHAHLAQKLRNMGFTPTKADFDLWIRKAKEGSYEYIASYVDDIIVVSKEAVSTTV